MPYMKNWEKPKSKVCVIIDLLHLCFLSIWFEQRAIWMNLNCDKLIDNWMKRIQESDLSTTLFLMMTSSLLNSIGLTKFWWNFFEDFVEKFSHFDFHFLFVISCPRLFFYTSNQLYKRDWLRLGKISLNEFLTIL